MVDFAMLDVLMANISKINHYATPKTDKKFLHLLWEFAPNIQGGLGVAGQALCQALSNYAKIHVVIPSTAKADIAEISKSSPDSMTVFQINLPESSYSDSYSNNAHNLLENTKIFSSGVENAHFTGYQAIHAHDWITAQAGIAVQKANGTPLILHIHSTQLDRVGLHSKDAIFEIEKKAMQAADHIVTVSQLSKNTLISEYAVSEKQITVIHNAIKPLNAPVERSPHPPTILFAGRVEQQKSPILAAEIICRTLNKIPEAKAIIAGAGSQLSEIRAVIKFKGLDARVEVLGHVPHDKMHLIYQSADVLISPSVSEPFGLVALEAAQSDLAVLLSDQYGASEILTSAPTIPIQDIDRWVDLSVQLLNSPKLLAKQIQSQKNDILAHNNSWKSAAEQLLAIIPD